MPAGLLGHAGFVKTRTEAFNPRLLPTFSVLSEAEACSKKYRQ
jgi:hypothetical protein